MPDDQSSLTLQAKKPFVRQWQTLASFMLGKGNWILLLCNLFGCGMAPTLNWEELLQQCPTDEEMGRLDVGDRIELRVYGEPEMTGEYELSPAGTINFPLLGTLMIAGQRCDEVAGNIRKGLAAKFFRNPSVSCLNKNIERTAVSVDGQVRQPGSVPYRRGMMLTDAIAESQGRTVRADLGAVIITRVSLTGVPRGAIVVPYEDIVQARSPNVCLHPGDVIYVPETTF